jgi:hypothetical protein
MPPKKITAPGAALQPLDTNQETLSLREARSQQYHGSFTFDDASPEAAELLAIPWPQSYKPPQLSIYDGHSDTKHFLMSYGATISSYGGNAAVMAKSFVMVVRNVA